MLYKPHFHWVLLTWCHKAAIWTSALHTRTSIHQLSPKQANLMNTPPPKKEKEISFCGIKLPPGLVLWSLTQNMGELHKYVQKAEHVAVLWVGKNLFWLKLGLTTVEIWTSEIHWASQDPRWQPEIWLTLETHGNNGGWSAKKSMNSSFGCICSRNLHFLLGCIVKFKWKCQQRPLNWKGNSIVYEETWHSKRGNGCRSVGQKQEIKKEKRRSKMKM